MATPVPTSLSHPIPIKLILHIPGLVTRTKDKVDLVIYGRNVMRLARHVESRCRVHGCRAGYYYDYITYKGYTIYEDTALQVKKLFLYLPLGPEGA